MSPLRNPNMTIYFNSYQSRFIDVYSPIRWANSLSRGGFHKWGTNGWFRIQNAWIYHEDWMIWGYHDFRKPPNLQTSAIVFCSHHLQLGQLGPQGFGDVGALWAHGCFQGLLAGLRMWGKVGKVGKGFVRGWMIRENLWKNHGESWVERIFKHHGLPQLLTREDGMGMG